MPMQLRRAAALLAAFLMILGAAKAQDELGWRPYVNPEFGYEILIPTRGFEVEDQEDKGFTLMQIGGSGQIDIYGAENTERLSVQQFADALARTDRIREITYSRMGSGWFVLSGYYRREGESRDDLIFYTKFMFNADRTALSAFEASYPIADKEYYDPIVTRLEKSLTSPRFSFQP